VIQTKEFLTRVLKQNKGYLENAQVDETVYRSHETIAQSDLKVLVNGSPKHYLQSRAGGDKKLTPALTLGIATHKAFFEWDTFLDEYSVIPETIDRRTKAGKAEWSEFQKESEGMKLLTADQIRTISNMMQNLQSIRIVREYTTGGYPERCFFRPPPPLYADRIPVSLKARFDYWQPDQKVIVDLKTTDSAAPERFLQSVKKYGYHIQAAYYLDFVDPGAEFIFVVVEKNPPYEVAVYKMDEAFIKQGRAVYTEGFRELAQCFYHDTWGGYPREVQTLECPEWTKRQWQRSIAESFDG